MAPSCEQVEKEEAGLKCCSCATGLMALLTGLQGHRQNSPRRAYSPTNNRRLLPNRNNSRVEEDYEVDDKVLGSGAFGSVRKVTRKQTAKERIMKTMLKEALEDPVAFKNEITIQADLDHPNICRVFDTFEDSKHVDIVMEYCHGGDVFDAICKVDHFDERDAHKLMSQVMRAVCYMHGKNIAHRDLKPENFLLQLKDVPLAENQIKVADFGFAQSFQPGEKSMTTKCGTPHFMAPEILTSDSFDEKCDIWSCGVILYMFLCGSPPFDGETDQDIFSRAAAGKLGFEDLIWKSVAATAKLSIVQMCLVNPSQRASAQKALQSPWMQQELSARGDPAVESAAIVQGMRNFQRHGRLKKAASYLVAHALPDDELAAMRSTFQGIDTNGDGLLSLEELKGGIGEAGVDCNNIEELFTELDKDGRGFVEWTEFLQAVANQSQLASEQACWEAFKVLDVDGSNTISVEEIREILSKGSRQRASVAEAREALKEADLDGDGKIDFQEFLAMMSGIQKTRTRSTMVP